MESDFKQLAAGTKRAVCRSPKIQDRSRGQVAPEVLGLVPPAEAFIESPSGRQGLWRIECRDLPEKADVRRGTWQAEVATPEDF
jgi:hypothetical protein